jgi:uroporphyrinogen-III synthase
MTDHPAPGPLAGRTVVVTRPVEGASELAELLEAAGAATVVMPLIEIVDVATADEDIDAAKSSLSGVGVFDLKSTF